MLNTNIYLKSRDKWYRLIKINLPVYYFNYVLWSRSIIWESILILKNLMMNKTLKIIMIGGWFLIVSFSSIKLIVIMFSVSVLFSNQDKKRIIKSKTKYFQKLLLTSSKPLNFSPWTPISPKSSKIISSIKCLKNL